MDDKRVTRSMTHLSKYKNKKIRTSISSCSSNSDLDFDSDDDNIKIKITEKDNNFYDTDYESITIDSYNSDLRF